MRQKRIMLILLTEIHSVLGKQKLVSLLSAVDACIAAIWHQFA